MPHQAFTLWGSVLQLVQQIPTQSSDAQGDSIEQVRGLLYQLGDLAPKTIPKETWQQLDKLQVGATCSQTCYRCCHLRLNPGPCISVLALVSASHRSSPEPVQHVDPGASFNPTTFDCTYGRPQPPVLNAQHFFCHLCCYRCLKS